MNTEAAFPLLSSNYAINPTPELDLRSNRALLPARVIAALDLLRESVNTMSIDTSGKWWKGTEPEDLEEYLSCLSEEAYKTSEFRLARCTCESLEFELHYNVNEEVARRKCGKCSEIHYICGSAEYWVPGLRMKKFKCIECRSTLANTGVGFSLYADQPGIRWLYVGERCISCGVLGSVIDWKVGLSDSFHLMEEA